VSALSNESRVQFELGHEEAIVLFELLADFQSEDALVIPSSAERLALIRLSGALERVLVDVFRTDYKEILRAARQRLVEQAGEMK
jgi:hypothetical protein